jgi:hypothetical protein
METKDLNVVCIRHRGYKGDTTPDLTCKACCVLYIQRLRQSQRGFSARKSSQSNEKSSLIDTKNA